jgi:hypothetical protein
MKKTVRAIFILSALMLLASCSSKKEELKPVSIGNLTFEYDANVWDHKESTTENAPLEFTDSKGNLISVYVSQESTYQHPMDMINFYKTMFSGYDEFKEFLAPKKVEVNGSSWYEYGYSYKDGTTIRKVYQRFYGKYYNAASISYSSTEDNYDTGYEEAVKMMSKIKASDVTNDVNEKKAHKFLVGDWEVKDSGYLVLKEDGTYEWYKDATKDTNNMHSGTYGCDVENATMSLKEGDGIYLVLFPEKLMVNGKAEETKSYKIDYLISFEQKEGVEGYQMVNMATYNLYTLIKK